ncbi:hypothetical protein FS837_004153 [Tulasnella sp. UAMH 9824]|nr:hypothetical protein FS837_004153 [Tulasnella sp. UAMH 9824]
MFAKFRSTRTPAAAPVPAPQFETGPPTQRVQEISIVVKKFLRVKQVFRRSSSAQKDAHHQDFPSRRQGVPTPSQPSQGSSALTHDDRAEPARRPYLHPSVEPTRSSPLLSLSPPFQAGWQGSLATSSAAHRSNLSATASPLLAPPNSLAATPSTPFAPTRPSSNCSTQSADPCLTTSPHTSPLLAPPAFVATALATSPALLIAELEETVAHLHRQYEDARRSVHTIIQWHVFPYTKSLADEAKKAKEELDEVLKEIAAVDTDCSKLEALWRDEQEKFEEAVEALKRAYWHREGIDEEHDLLLAKNHELQAGQPVDGVWQQRPSEPLRQDSTPSQSVGSQERGSSLATLESSQRVKSWDSQWQSTIERQRYSLPRPVQVTTSEANESKRRTNNARPADTSEYFGTPLRWAQLAPVSSVHPQQGNAREHA